MLHSDREGLAGGRGPAPAPRAASSSGRTGIRPVPGALLFWPRRADGPCPGAPRSHGVGRDAIRVPRARRARSARCRGGSSERAPCSRARRVRGRRQRMGSTARRRPLRSVEGGAGARIRQLFRARAHRAPGERPAVRYGAVSHRRRMRPCRDGVACSCLLRAGLRGTRCPVRTGEAAAGCDARTAQSCGRDGGLTGSVARRPRFSRPHRRPACRGRGPSSIREQRRVQRCRCHDSPSRIRP